MRKAKVKPATPAAVVAPKRQHNRDRDRQTPKVEIVVTEEVIAKSTLRDSRHCIIAEAIRLAVPHAQSIAVDLATIRFSDPKQRKRYTYLTPRIAQIELVKFDRGNKTEPFNFMLRAGMVTTMGTIAGNMMPKKGVLTPAKEAAMTKARLVKSGRNSKRPSVADRVGGRLPPKHKMSDGVPFSRRRAFGLRGLEL